VAGSCGAGTLIATWDSSSLRNCVLVPFLSGALPIIVEQLREVAAHVQFGISIVGNMLGIDIPPAGIDALLREAHIDPWLRPALPPVRILLSASLLECGHTVQHCEMVRPAGGQDLTWLLRTPTATDPDALAAALASRIGATVVAQPLRPGIPGTTSTAL